MRLDFSLTLPEALYAQLIEDCAACAVSPKQYAAEALESVIASRRLPKVELGRNGAFTSGYGFSTREDVQEDDDVEIVEHRILL